MAENNAADGAENLDASAEENSAPATAPSDESDMSMEEVLASIRKIIASDDDNEPAIAPEEDEDLPLEEKPAAPAPIDTAPEKSEPIEKEVPVETVSAETKEVHPPKKPEVEEKTPVEKAPSEDAVLDLTQEVKPDGTVIDLSKENETGATTEENPEDTTDDADAHHESAAEITKEPAPEVTAEPEPEEDEDLEEADSALDQLLSGLEEKSPANETTESMPEVPAAAESHEEVSETSDEMPALTEEPTEAATTQDVDPANEHAEELHHETDEDEEEADDIDISQFMNAMDEVENHDTPDAPDAPAPPHQDESNDLGEDLTEIADSLPNMQDELLEEPVTDAIDEEEQRIMDASTPDHVTELDEALVSDKTEQATLHSLGKLHNSIKHQATDTGIIGGATSLESLAMTALTPMIKAWVDENLPPLVERIVKEEIKKIVKKSSE